jgi:EmrB/QacA subfamily drug resistance transporter
VIKVRKWIPLTALCLGAFMLLVDTTIVNVALPDMAVSLPASFASLQWVIDAYALTLAALVLATGSAADLVGHRRVFVLGLIGFGAASLGCALAQDSAALIAARAAQGAGAAAMLATTFPLLNSNYTGRDRGVAYGVWGAVNGAASMAGPVVGGLLTQAASWQWIFFVNLPLCLLALPACRYLRTDTRATDRGNVDLLGTATFTAAAGTLAYGLIQTDSHRETTVAPWAWLAAALVLLGVFVMVELHAQRPLLELRLLRSRTLVGTLISAGALTFAAFGPYLYVAIWTQTVLGMSPLAAGLVAVPLSAAAFTVSIGVGRRLHDSDPRWIISGGLLLIGSGALLNVQLLQVTTTWTGLIPGSVITGIGVGLATPTLAATAMAVVPVSRGGMTAGAVNTMRQLGFAFGIATLGTIFVSRAGSTLSEYGVPYPGTVAEQLSSGQAHLTLQRASGIAHELLDVALNPATIGALRATFLACGLVGLVAGLLAAVLIRTRTVESGHVVLSPTEVSAQSAQLHPTPSLDTAIQP